MTKKWIHKKPKLKYDARAHIIGFETTLKTEKKWKRYIRILLKTGSKKDRDLAKWMKSCNKRKRCLLAVCPICNRRYRIWLCGQAQRLIKKHRNVKFVTLIMPDKVRPGHLSKHSILKFKNRLWKQLDRVGFSKAIIVGGFEVDFDYRVNKWILHFHLHIANSTKAERQELRKRYYKTTKTRYRPMQVQKSDCKARVFLYGFKFSKYKGPDIRRKELYKPELIEAMHFWSRHSVHERTFMMGKKRSGRNIVDSK